MVTSVATPQYRIVIMTQDRRDDADELEAELRAQTLSIAGRRVALEVGRDVAALAGISDPDGPPTALVVLSGGSRTARDPVIAEAVEQCRQQLIPVLPVCADLRHFRTQTPETLWPINGKQWSIGSPAGAVASEGLRLVGLSETDRRIFLSYRRDDGARLAEQLRIALGNERWDVFLDRFSVPPAVDFQKRLDRELADKAFVLLLETPKASESDWIDHEVTFALRHRLGLLSLTSPDTAETQLFPSVPEAWRRRLADGDFEGGPPHAELTPVALDTILVNIEVGHAAATRLRRDSVMTDAKAEMLKLGYEVRPVDEWMLLGTRGNEQELVLATAHAPVASDLRRAETQRRRLRQPGEPTRAWLVHPTDDVDLDRASLLQWLTQHRRVKSTPLMLLGARMSP